MTDLMIGGSNSSQPYLPRIINTEFKADPDNTAVKSPIIEKLLFKDKTSCSSQASGRSLKFLDLFSTNQIDKKELIADPGVSERTKSALSQIDGVCWAGKPVSNGNRETAVIFPKGLDLNKPVEIIYFFHGDGGNIHDSIMPPSPPAFAAGKHGFKDEIEKLGKERNAVFVFPEAPGKWKNDPKMNMEEFQKEMTEKIKSLQPKANIGSVDVKAFSGGGYALYKASAEGRLKADRVDLYDASYNPWGVVTYNNLIKQNPDIKMNVYYVKGANTENNATTIASKAKNNSNIKVFAEPLVNNSLWESHYRVPNTHFGD